MAWTRKPEQHHAGLGQQPDGEPRSCHEFHFGRPRQWVFFHTRKNWILAGVRGPRTDICMMKSLNPACGFLLLSRSSWAPSCHKSRVNTQSPHRESRNCTASAMSRAGERAMPTWARGGEHLDPFSTQSFGGQSFRTAVWGCSSCQLWNPMRLRKTRRPVLHRSVLMDSQVISSIVQKACGMIEARRRQWHVSNLIRRHLISAE